MSRFAINFWGVEIGVRCDIPEYDQAVTKLLLPIWKDQPALQPADWFRLRIGLSGQPVVEGPEENIPKLDVTDPVDILEQRLHMHLAANAVGAVFVHAGVVIVDGRAIVIPGLSYSGKSRLTMALVAQGARLFSDEYAIIDQQGMVHPFPRPVWLRQPGGLERVEASALGWSGDLPAARMGAVIATRYQAGSSWEPEPLSEGEMVLELLGNTVSGQAQPKLALQCLAAAVSSGQGWRGVRGEAEQTATRITGLLD